MQRNTLTLLAIAAIVLVGGGALWAARNDTKAKSATEAKSPAATNAAEEQFLVQMISHHADAIGMAQLAPEMAKATEVKTLAADIAKDQQSEIDKMKIWYKLWYGKDIPEMADMSGHSEESGMMMNELRSSSNFDLVFVTQMIPHHQSAVEMAKSILPKATHQEVKDLANSIITSQTAEIEHMTKLKQSL